jgi:beta-glucosidase
VKVKRTVSHLRRLACIVLFSGSFTIAANGQSAACTPGTCPWLDASRPTEDRIHDLLSQMTLEEKASQMQDVSVAIPRLGVPGYNWWNEALHGVARRGIATVFPQAIALGATWDTELLQQVGDTIATEGRAKFNESPTQDKKRYFGLTYWSPNINIFRDPRWGRGQETYGEDPYLTGRLGTAFVLGVQGDDPKYLKALATPKHFAVHSGPEPLRHGFNVNVSPYDLEDTYLPAFRMAVTEGHAGSIMCAYNAIDGAPACASKLLLQQHLVQAWGFKGYVVSDCDAVGDVSGGHHFAKDAAEASADTLKAGTDLDCGSTYKALSDAVKRGLIAESAMDAALTRLLRARFQLGLFDPPAVVPFSSISPAENDSAAHRRLALRAAQESTVLLKNDGILPLKSSPHTIAIIGPTAESTEVMQGNYNGSASHPVLARAGFTARFKDASIVYAPGAVLAPGFLVSVPQTSLHTEASVGLKAEYFDNADLRGTPVLTRIDKSVHFDWRHAAPAPSVPADHFSVRWSGTITFPFTGDYTLKLGSPRNAAAESASAVQQPRIRFFLDGKPVLADPANPFQAILHSDDPKPHALRLEYVRTPADESINLQWQIPNAPLIAEAVRTASTADIVFAFVGLSPQLEGEEMNVHIPGFDGGDRTNIDLPAPQQQLLEALKKTGKPLVVVLNSGSAVALNWAEKNADAVLAQWYPGEVGGEALASIVAGDVSPSGRLPVTFYRSSEDLPSFTDYSMKNRTYRYYTGAVLYPFGFGLSYTKFLYSQPTLSTRTLQAGDTLTATFQVKNEGVRDADEVVEAYLKQPQFKLSPKLALAGFTRVHLAAGEARAVTLTLTPRQLSQVDAEGNRAVQPGEYTLYLGGGQPDTTAPSTSIRFQVKGTQTLPQ